ncbi:MAG: hypothetical protein PHP10_05145 [Candidatus Omnitrophica bacterium]|nr:hypothetical protein [Candidatus Omnitrophota bacterium]
MKKVMVIFFILSLFVLGFSLSQALAAAGNPEAEAIAQEFTQNVMNKFKSAEHPELDQAAISDKVDDYSKRFAGILLEAGLDAKTAGMIMQQVALWYGQSLDDLFNAKPYNIVIQAYSAKIADLFSKQQLNMDTQSKIVDMTSDNLESLNDLFHPMEDIDD